MVKRVHELWSSRFGFLVATIGVSVGLGNLWRFPFIAGLNGGGAFVLLYVFFVVMLAIPMLMAELALGRRGRGSPVLTMKRLAAESKGSRFWHSVGYISVLVPFLGLAYYAVVAGWSFDYISRGIRGAFTGLDAESSHQAFLHLTGSPARVFFLNAAVILLTALVVGRGLKKGIERVAKVMMPALFVILLVLVGYGMTSPAFGRSVEFLFAPDFSELTPRAVMMALGQAFYSIAVGVGAMITYSAHLPEDAELPHAAATIGFADTLVALLAGLAIFPVVFAAGLDPAGGPGLIFETLPIAFGVMPGGNFFGTLFFILLFFAAFTSTIGMLEPVVAWVEEHLPGGRTGLAFGTAGIILLISLGPSFSFNILADVRPLSFLPAMADYDIFRTIDFFVANLVLPTNILLMALFTGWVLSRQTAKEALGLKGWNFELWHVIVRYVAPIGILATLAFGIYTGGG